MENLDKLTQMIEKELKTVEEKGLSTSNLESTSKLIDMLKDLKEVQEDSYGRRGPYKIEGYAGYDNGSYREDYRGDYRQNYMGGYNGRDSRMRDHISRISESAEKYEYGRERYQHGDSGERLYEGLESLMYAICMFIESTMDFAQSPREKDIIRKHINKIRSI